MYLYSEASLAGWTAKLINLIYILYRRNGLSVCPFFWGWLLYLGRQLQSLSDIVTTLGWEQNSRNIQYLSQGDNLSLCPVRKLRVKIVRISDFCQKVIVTIFDKDCTRKKRLIHWVFVLCTRQGWKRVFPRAGLHLGNGQCSRGRKDKKVRRLSNTRCGSVGDTKLMQRLFAPHTHR